MTQSNTAYYYDTVQYSLLLWHSPIQLTTMTQSNTAYYYDTVQYVSHEDPPPREILETNIKWMLSHISRLKLISLISVRVTYPEKKRRILLTFVGYFMTKSSL